MGLLNIFARSKPLPKPTGTQQISNPISLDIVPRPNPRSMEDITTWLSAIRIAEDPNYPRRLRLYNMYETVEIDNHLSSLVEKRIMRVQGSKFKLVNIAPNVTEQMEEQAEQAAELLERPWFDDFLRYSMESIFWGHSLIQFNDFVNGEVDSIELIPRKHVKPEYGQWLIMEGDMEGPQYRGTSLMDWYIEVGKPKDLGLFKKAGPMALWKKNSLAQWSQYSELFGIPFRTFKTPGRDQKRMNVLQDIAANMGTAGWAIIQDDETVEILENKQTDSYKVFDMLIERANSEMSKLILHQTMTTDNGSSRSQAEVHEGVAEEVHLADKTFIRYVINQKLIPLLIKHGYPFAGLRLDWDDTTTLAPEDRIKVDSLLLQYYELDTEYIEQTYNVKVVGLKNKSAPQIQDALQEGLDRKKSGKGPAETDPQEEEETEQNDAG